MGVKISLHNLLNPEFLEKVAQKMLQKHDYMEKDLLKL